MGIFSSAKKEKIVAIFDIGSGSVGGAIVRMPNNKNSIPVVVGSARADITLRPDLSFERFLDDMKKALDSTAQSLYALRRGIPDEIFCVLASPWYLSQSRVIKIEKDKPFIFTRRMADDLLRRELSLLANVYEEKYGKTKSAPLMIEHHIIGVRLNGYTVDDPIGKKAKSLELDMVISLSPALCIDAIKETLLKTYPHIPGTFASFMTSAYLAVRDTYMTADSYLLVDVGGEVTDVAIVSNGVLKSSISFPFGKHTFFRYLCTKQQCELRDARELFSLFQSGAIDENRSNQIKPLMASVEQSWGESFHQSVLALPHPLGLPNMIFLTADLDVRDWFAGALTKEPHITQLLSLHTARVISLSGEEFLNSCSVAGGTCDPFIMIEAIAKMKKMRP